MKNFKLNIIFYAIVLFVIFILTLNIRTCRKEKHKSEPIIKTNISKKHDDVQLDDSPTIVVKSEVEQITAPKNITSFIYFEQDIKKDNDTIWRTYRLVYQ